MSFILDGISLLWVFVVYWITCTALQCPILDFLKQKNVQSDTDRLYRSTLSDSEFVKNIDCWSRFYLTYYLPRDFGSVVLTAVYIHPQADIDGAISTLSNLVTAFENSHNDFLSIVAGDFDKSSLKSRLPNHKQQVTCRTRVSNILDHCYCPFKNAYKTYLHLATQTTNWCC